MSKYLLLLVPIYVALLTLVNNTNASDLLTSADTLRILKYIELHRNKVSDEDLNAAYALNTEGDRAYKKRNYRLAYTAYYNSYPNAPTAYAYIMAGDSYWRSILHYQASRPLKKDESCRLGNSYFAHDFESHIAQNQTVGLLLAERMKDEKFMNSSLYKRARQSTFCLKNLIQKYKTKPKTACIDLSQLHNCLGEPLIK